MKLCNVCDTNPKAPGRGRRTCEECFGKCKHCKQELDERQRCRPCIKKRNRERYQNDPEYAERKRIANKLSLYGISREEYDALPKQCFTCDATEDLAIDHNHETGVVRGILCKRCNSALGFLKEDPARIGRLIQYLEETK